jgi:hypothetical protein
MRPPRLGSAGIALATVSDATSFWPPTLVHRRVAASLAARAALNRPLSVTGCARLVVNEAGPGPIIPVRVPERLLALPREHRS